MDSLINRGEVKEFCDDLNSYLKTRYNYKKNHAKVECFGEVVAALGLLKFGLYLRFKPNYKPWPANTLVIARVSFQQTRVGNGKDFIKFICEKADKFNFENIAIEYTNESSMNFAMKYGFLKLGHENNWCGSINHIRNKINRVE